VVLFGTEYWGGLLDWMRGTLVAQQKIKAADVDLLQVTDDVEEAVDVIRRSELG
jgi:predicted Rossmann-fold nucleotide-binding protein